MSNLAETMEVFTLKEAARKAKMGVQTLKRACEEGLIKAVKLPSRQWRVTESALEEAMHKGIDLRSLPKRAKGKNPQPEQLRKAAEKRKAEKSKNKLAT